MPRKSQEGARSCADEPKGGIRVGPAGWSYPDWNGIVYPTHRPAGFHEAEYLAQFFDTIEINTSFYNPLKPEMCRQWIARVAANPAFLFTAKLWQRFTHDGSTGSQDVAAARAGFDVLHAAGRLGAVLLQFPFSFHNTPENHAHLEKLLALFHEYPLVVEVRHSSWNQKEFYQFLHTRGCGFCNIDQPVIGRSIAPSARATAPVGYVRLHGRNYEHWFTSNEHPEERYNYLYSQAELEPWAARIQNIAQHAQLTFVITNNHFQGKAIANALQLISLIRNQPVRVPETLREFYPELAKIARTETSPSLPVQSDLLFAGNRTE